MKRTALERYTPINPRRSKPRQTTVFRCRAYLDFLSEHCRCVVCTKIGSGQPASFQIVPEALWWMLRILDPAHGPPAGLGIKGPDDGAICLCRYHHDEQTNMPGGWEAFEAKYGFSREIEAANHYAVFLIWKESQS